MSLTGNNGLLAAAGANQPAYTIDQSLRFDDGNTVLYHYPDSDYSDGTRWTLSTWIKLEGEKTSNTILLHGQANNTGNDGENRTYLGWWWDTNGYNLFYNVRRSNAWETRITFNPNLSDFAGWYHVLFVYNSNESSADDRLKFYLNGVLVTDRTTTDSVSSGATSFIMLNGGLTNVHGHWNSSAPRGPGYMAETHWIDGQALTVGDFGETDSDTNQWKPIEYTGTYGNSGFYFKFQDSSNLGDDSSGNGHDFTNHNLVATDLTIDSPTNNFCTLNSVDAFNSMTATEGGLRANTNSGSDPKINATFGIPQSGKWYWEFVDQHGLSIMVGVIDQINSGNIYGNNNSAIYSSGLGTKYNFSSVSSYGASWTTGDIIGVAINRDDNEITFYKNNSSQGTFTIGGTAAQRARLIPVIGTGTGGTGGGTFNFGQDSSFHGTKTAQGNTDANGKGDFYYTPPSGYLALCTDNLPEPSIILPTEHFNTITYTGNGTSPQARTGLGHKPSFLWIKDRGASNNHVLTDAIRGPNGAGGTGQAGLLYSNATTAEVTGASQVKSYDTDGFTTHSTTYVNENTNTYVAWSWKGSDTPSKTYAVTVTNPGSGNRYTLDTRVSGTNAIPITLEEGGTYTFDQADNSNSGHPLRFSTTANGTHGGGSEYTTGVTTNGTPGSAGAYTRITVAESAPTLYYYCTAHSGMGAEITTPGSGGGVSNLSGSIASVVNSNTTNGISIISYTGNQDPGGTGETIAHGLSQAPEIAFFKNRDGTNDWIVGCTPVGWTQYASLNQTDAFAASNSPFRDTAPTSSYITLGGSHSLNKSANDYICYAFHSVDGYSKVGSYEGNASSTDNAFVYTGFRPAFILQKNADAGSSWWLMHDNKRTPYNQAGTALGAQASNGDTTGFKIDILSNGFKVRDAEPSLGNSNTYIYLAFAETPFKTSNAR